MSTLKIAEGSHPGVSQVGLRRVLNLTDLVWYGMILIQPIAAVPLFGIADQISEGHVVTTIAIAMVAMMLTAVSYGVMATVYPTAGSAYTYVGLGLNRHLGLLTGWAMILDYFMIPVISIIYGSLTLNRIFPAVSYSTGAVSFAVVITVLNLLGVQSTARTNKVLLTIMGSIIVVFFVAAVIHVHSTSGTSALFSTAPFYTPGTFHVHAIATATSLAALTYIGFDGITTLTEEARNPKRDILIATVLVCLLTGILSGALVYLGQIVWPNYKSFISPDTAFMDVARRIGGKYLFQAFALILILASLGSGLAAQAGAARLLLSMGRDGVISKTVFAHVDRRRQVPSYNICIIGVVALIGAMFFSFERAAELVNFGAFLAFTGVNVTAAWHFLSIHRRGLALLSALGAVFCLMIWWSLPQPAKISGFIWLGIGLAYAAVRTRWFRCAPLLSEFQ